MSGRVFLDGYMDVPPDRLDAVTDALPAHIALTLAEPGCLQFEVAFSADSPGRLRVSEIFVDQAAFDAHQERSRASAWGDITAGLTRNYSLRTEP